MAACMLLFCACYISKATNSCHPKHTFTTTITNIMTAVVRFADLDPSMFEIEKPEKMKNGMGYLAKVVGPKVQTPVCRLPWDTKVDVSQGRPQCKVALSLNKDSNDHTTFVNLLNTIDKKFIEVVKSNRLELFGKKVSNELIEESFYPSAKPSNNDKYGPTFQAKVPFVEKEYGPVDDEPEAKRARTDAFDSGYRLNVDCCDRDKNQVDAESALSKANKVALLVTPKQIWCINGRSGVTWQTCAALVTEMQSTAPSFEGFDMSAVEE